MMTFNKLKDKDFTILNLTDTQLDDPEWDEAHSGGKILKFTVQELVNRVHPDLITVTGDLAWAERFDSYRNLAELLESTGIDWCPVWGNHDNQGGPENVQKVVDMYRSFPHFKYETGAPSMGNGNYVVKITEEECPITSIILMDSHDREERVNANGETESHWARLWPNQIEWYEQMVELLKAQGFDESILMLHIPIYAYRTAFDHAFNQSVTPKRMVMADSLTNAYWKPGYESSFGVCHDDICSFPEDDGVLAAILKHQHTKTILCGHDHINNWMIKDEGILFAYGLKTGAGCYWEKELSGGTVLKIGSNGLKDIYHEYVDVSHLLN